jgi:Protein of unknown function (DUF 659)
MLITRKSQNILRTDAPQLTRKELAGPLLNAAYDDLKERKLKINSKHCSYTTDASDNVNHEPIVTYMSKHGRSTFFEETVSTKTQSHNAKWIADDLIRVANENTPHNSIWAGATTDNTSTNKAAWKILRQQFPYKFFQGCVCHGLHLAVHDICDALP